MPYLTGRVCEGCSKTFTPVNGTGWLCPSCAEKSKGRRREFDRSRDAVDEYRDFLHGTPWRNTSAMVRNQNPQCQMIGDDGKQCQYASSEVHHIKSGRDYPALRLKLENLVALCSRCHNNHSGDLHTRKYAPTVQIVFGIRTEYPH
jgi:5-methylcytosine-specific restriction endonuclease McrA